MRLGYKERTLLLGCGAAGAIAGIFKAPIAGVVFTLEVLMLDLTLLSVVPLLISAASGALVAFFLMGKQVIFSFDLKDIYTLRDVPFFLVLGIFTGFISVYFSRVTLFIESRFKKITRGYQKVILGGLILGVLIFFFPTLYGEGYETISALLAGNPTMVLEGSVFHFLADHSHWFLVYLALIVLFKVVAMSVTTGAGGVGGIFAPTLFTGGVAGYLFARFFNDVANTTMSESNFVLNGMAGLMAGVMHAPLTGIFLIAEITGGYELLVPLIITSTVSYLTIMYFEPHSIYAKRLARRGELITHDKDQKVLTLMDWKKEIEKDFSMVGPDDTLKELVRIISKSRRNVFPVVDDSDQLVGLVLLDHIREIIFQQELYEHTLVQDLMILPQTTISIDDNMNQILDKFKETDSWNLPVVRENKYVGFISKSRIFSAYRKVLVDVT
jgi:CIC family chloride channel protein